MRIADLMKRKNRKVLVRVPTKLTEKLGFEVKGTVQGLQKKGNITWVRVKIARKGIFEFRPQDLEAA